MGNSTVQVMAKATPGLGRSQGGPKQMSTPVGYHHSFPLVKRKNISLD